MENLLHEKSLSADHRGTPLHPAVLNSSLPEQLEA